MHRHTARKSRVHVYISNKTLLIFFPFFLLIFKDVDDEQIDVWERKRKEKKRRKKKGGRGGGSVQIVAPIGGLLGDWTGNKRKICPPLLI